MKLLSLTLLVLYHWFFCHGVTCTENEAANLQNDGNITFDESSTTLKQSVLPELDNSTRVGVKK